MAKIIVAIVGPQDSVALIEEVAREREAALQVVPLVYQDASEVAAILAAHSESVDVFLFSGIVPYRRAVAANVTAKPLLYIPHTGSSLYRIMLQAMQDSALAWQSISFDTFREEEIAEAFGDVPLPLPHIVVSPQQGIVLAQDMTAFHYNLWQSGQTQLAVTCFLSTYQELVRLGVPALRIWPTRDNIRTMLTIAVSKGEAMRYKGGQIAIQHIAIDQYEEFVRNSPSRYDVQRVELQLYELLVDYTEAVKGAIDIHGNGGYTIYSTRGLVESVTQQFTVMPILEDITCRLKVDVSGGIGFGQTAHEADANAHTALSMARRNGKGQWMVLLDDKILIGPLSSSTQLAYSIASEDKLGRELAQLLNVSVTTANRLMAIFTKIDKQMLHADDLASYLSVTTRSARRVLGSMVEQGLAVVAGEEVLDKGRPRKLYRIDVSKVLQAKSVTT